MKEIVKLIFQIAYFVFLNIKSPEVTIKLERNQGKSSMENRTL